LKLLEQPSPETVLRVVVMFEKKHVHLKDVKLNHDLQNGIAWEEACMGHTIFKVAKSRFV
jgi:hypothetical protein